MVNSILDDIKGTFRSGNMISKIIMVNVGLFVLINLIKVFGSAEFYTSVSHWLSLPSDPARIIKQPWSIMTHMFLHAGFWHIFWNMLILYWFGQIMGDLLGDERVLPIYLLAGLAGGLVYILHDLVLPGGTGGAAYALGASAAVMAIVWASAMTSPDYEMRLLLLGAVKLKYIALALLFMDLVGSAGDINKGGHFAHMGGAAFGMLYVFLLRRGTDLASPLVRLFNRRKDYYDPEPPRRPVKTERSKFKILHNALKTDNEKPTAPSFNEQEELDRILDKIKLKGYENLDDEEKDFLYRASKKK